MCVAGFDEGAEGLMDPHEMSRNINASFETMKNNVSGTDTGSYKYGDFNQTIVVNDKVSTPDELARVVRIESRYGLMRGVAYG